MCVCVSKSVSKTHDQQIMLIVFSVQPGQSNFVFHTLVSNLWTWENNQKRSQGSRRKSYLNGCAGGGRTDNQSQTPNTKQRAVCSRQFFAWNSRGPAAIKQTLANKAMLGGGSTVWSTVCTCSQEEWVVICCETIDVPSFSIIILLLVTKSHTQTRHRVT